MQSSGSGEQSFVSWGVDPVVGAGGWVDESGDLYVRDGYLAMSGMNECPFDENMN